MENEFGIIQLDLKTGEQVYLTREILLSMPEEERQRNLYFFEDKIPENIFD